MRPPPRHALRPSAPTPAVGHRADLDGLRALAIALVVIYHIWFGGVSGGVDVFLMLSAYFLTASLVRRAVSGSRIRLGRYWLNRFAALLPAAAVTIVGVLISTYLLRPEPTWPRIWDEAWASLLYVQNWELARSEVDYYARDLSTASPLQHFWSLSVQGQVFILWPVLIAATTLAVGSRRQRIVPALTAVFSLVFVTSLTYSVLTTSQDQTGAYFDTGARLWEFAAGSLVALLLPRWRLPGVVRAVAGWIGVLGIVLCGVVLDVEQSFPGYVALWPVLCTALVIASGTAPTRGGVGALLRCRPLQAIGRIAYALYLVHWPILITWLLLRGQDGVGLLGGTVVATVSLVVARLVTRDIERPLRRFAPSAAPAWWRQGIVVTATVALVAGTLGAWQYRSTSTPSGYSADDPQQYPGAAAVDLLDGVFVQDRPLLPLAASLSQEWVEPGAPCRGRLRPAHPALTGTCFHVRNDGSAARLMVIGDSHAQQLAAPLFEIAEVEGWDVTSVLKGGCPLGVGELTLSIDGPEGCEVWRRAAVDYAVAQQPDAVYLVRTKATPHRAERMITGIDAVVAELLDAGIDVITVRDNPRFSFDMYTCVLTGSECTVPVEHILGPVDPASDIDDRALTIDFTPWLCPGGSCLGSIGNLAVYLDDNHLTRAYGRTLAPVLLSQLQAQSDRMNRLGLGVA